ncbi:MAG: ATP-binding cassette domain-containing protein [Candidatus Lokiarchaeota archaeon]|nr:ATP-binding cassette domain-containing protein [Candidatus Lokiarchaeota archaeon]
MVSTSFDEIRVEGLYFHYEKKPALKEVGFSAKKGRITAVIGPNGAGKTTLFKVIDLLARASSGRVFAGGKDVLALPPAEARAWRQSISFVMQEPYLFNMSVRQNLAVPLKMRKIPRSKIDRIVQDAIIKFGLGEIAEKKPFRVSSGERKRAGLARALVTEPALLILDEPTASIDPEASYLIEQYLKDLRAEGRTIIMMSTHDLFQARRLADDVALLFKGELIEAGTKDDIFDRPRNEITRKFVNGEILVENVRESCEALGRAPSTLRSTG